MLQVAANITAVLRSPLLWATWHLLQVWEILYWRHYQKCVIFAAILNYWELHLGEGKNCSVGTGQLLPVHSPVSLNQKYYVTAALERLVGLFLPPAPTAEGLDSQVLSECQSSPQEHPATLLQQRWVLLSGGLLCGSSHSVLLAWGCLPPLSPACPALRPWPRWSHGTPVVPLYVLLHKKKIICNA